MILSIIIAEQDIRVTVAAIITVLSSSVITISAFFITLGTFTNTLDMSLVSSFSLCFLLRYLRNSLLGDLNITEDGVEVVAGVVAAVVASNSKSHGGTIGSLFSLIVDCFLHVKTISRYLWVPGQGSPNTAVLTCIEQVLLPPHLALTILLVTGCMQVVMVEVVVVLGQIEVDSLP